jgi:hypothetical protein
LTHNPWVILQTVSNKTLQDAAGDPAFQARIAELLQEKHESAAAPAWFQQAHPDSRLRAAAYFSMEFMLSEALPIYSGGLGNVAGDQLKAASDLAASVIGAGLLYQQGYFRQEIDSAGAQHALYPFNDPGQLPIKPPRDADGDQRPGEPAAPSRHHQRDVRRWESAAGGCWTNSACIPRCAILMKATRRLPFWNARAATWSGTGIFRVYLPPDANTLLWVMDTCLRSRNCVNVIVAGKQPALQWLAMDAAIRHCTTGVGIWDFASNDQRGEPDVVMACAGDIPTLETLAAADLLRAHFQDLKIRVVNVVDLMTLQPSSEHPHGLSDRDFDSMFTTDKPIIFAYHGYPWLIHRLTYRRTNHHYHALRHDGAQRPGPLPPGRRRCGPRPAPRLHRRPLQAVSPRQAHRAQALHRAVWRRHARDPRMALARVTEIACPGHALVHPGGKESWEFSRSSRRALSVTDAFPGESRKGAAGRRVAPDQGAAAWSGRTHLRRPR